MPWQSNFTSSASLVYSGCNYEHSLMKSATEQIFHKPAVQRQAREQVRKPAACLHAIQAPLGNIKLLSWLLQTAALTVLGPGSAFHQTSLPLIP